MADGGVPSVADVPAAGTYGKRELVAAYLGHADRGHGGYLTDSQTYNAALKAYHVAMLNGLQQLFGLRLDPDGVGAFDNRVLFMLFASTADSLLSLRSPWSGFLEAGLLLRKIEQAGPLGAQIMESSRHIDELASQSRQVHLDMLEALLSVMLGDRADRTFSRADLQAIGVDDSRPDPGDYPLYDD